MDYATIKKARKDGQKASAEQLDAAIVDQTKVYNDAAKTLADATLAAALTFTATPILTDDECSAAREAVRDADRALADERRRLSKLRAWRKKLDYQPIGEIEIPDTLPDDFGPQSA